MARNKLVAGAGVKCLLNGVAIGTITGIDWQFVTPKEEERGVDAMLPFEQAPMHAAVAGNVQLYRTRDDNGLEGLGIINPMGYIAEDQYFVLELKDIKTGNCYLKVTQAVVNNQNWSVRAKGVLTGQFSFAGNMAKSGPRG